MISHTISTSFGIWFGKMKHLKRDIWFGHFPLLTHPNVALTDVTSFRLNYVSIINKGYIFGTETKYIYLYWHACQLGDISKRQVLHHAVIGLYL